MKLPTALLTLKAATIIVIAFGAMCFFGIFNATQFPLVLTADIIFWPPGDALNIQISPESKLLSAILGGVMCGWGVASWIILQKIFPQNPNLARSIILPSILVWFVVDSIASLLGPAPMNAFFNLFFLAPFLIPLLMMEKGNEPNETHMKMNLS